MGNLPTVKGLCWPQPISGRSDTGLGTGVLNLPYRPRLPTAKVIATIQELSGGRLRLGVGTGWMEPEFRALGIDRRQRGRSTDATLAFLRRCFEADEVEENGQRFLFLPRPVRPRIYVGGAPPHAIERAVRFGDGWLPIGGDPERLAEPIATLRARAQDAGRPSPEVVVMTALPLDDPDRAAERARAFAAVGATQLIHASRYADAASFRENVRVLAERVRD